MVRCVRVSLTAFCAMLLGCSGAKNVDQPRREATAMRNSTLQLAIVRGKQPGGSLADELGKLDDYVISTRDDAQAVCSALADIPYAAETDKISSDLSKLADLFQNVKDPNTAGFRVLRTEGTAQLVRIFDASLKRTDADEDDLLFVLKILAIYGTRDGADRIVTAARQPVKPDGYLWSAILRVLSSKHPQRDYVFQRLQNPFPEKFIAIALLDSANEAALAGESDDHPFNNEQGAAQLRQWLASTDKDHFSYAVSAVVALPFVNERWRSDLFALAANHPDQNVGLEAAWAKAKSGDKSGVDELARLCLKVNLSKQAQRYLAELGEADAVPVEATNADFQAQAEFSQWLAHPNELGRPPDELKIVDRRTLTWPPEREPLPFWLIRYRLRDTTGLDVDDENCGLVGSTTWCFFSYDLHQRPPEDAYAIHCYWEMVGQDLITEDDDPDPKEYAALLGQWMGPKLESLQIVKVADLSPRLKYPQRLVALASARQDGREGWVVLDQSRSSWYDPADFPGDSPESTLLDLHVGRVLLGFTGPVNRARFLQPPARRDPRSVVEAYERLLVESQTGDARRRKELLAEYGSPLLKHFIVMSKRSCPSRSCRGEPRSVRATIASWLPFAPVLPTFSTKRWMDLVCPCAMSFRSTLTP
jgi:hypothetical protein